MPTVVLVSLEDYWRMAMDIWSLSHVRGSARTECSKCKQDFKAEKRGVPVFPPDYKDKCPRCGGELHGTLPG